MDTYNYKGQRISLTAPEDRQRALNAIDNDFLRRNRPTSNNPTSEELAKILEKAIYRASQFSPTGSSVVRDTDINTIEVLFRNNDPEITKAFLYAMYKLGNKEIENVIKHIAEIRVNNYERLLALPDMSNSVRQVLEWEYNNYTFLKDFLDGVRDPLVMVNEPIIVNADFSLQRYRMNFLKIGFILVFAGFFLAVVIAFILNMVRSIKNDAEAMQKINDALGRNAE
jgi:hypothetical protein